MLRSPVLGQRMFDLLYYLRWQTSRPRRRNEFAIPITRPAVALPGRMADARAARHHGRAGAQIVADLKANSGDDGNHVDHHDQRSAAVSRVIALRPGDTQDARPSNGGSRQPAVYRLRAAGTSLHLDLNGRAVLVNGTGDDHQIATLDLGLAAHHVNCELAPPAKWSWPRAHSGSNGDAQPRHLH